MAALILPAKLEKIHATETPRCRVAARRGSTLGEERSLTKTISLVCGRVALVSNEDYEWLACYSWRMEHGYAKRVVKDDGAQRRISMHREVLGLAPGQQADHADRNRLNNQRENLRVCTGSQNNLNRTKQETYCGRPVSSRFKGVCWNARHEKWDAYITWLGKRKALGRFDEERLAARAYDVAADGCDERFAALNFPGELEQSRRLIAALPKRLSPQVSNGLRVCWNGHEINAQNTYFRKSNGEVVYCKACKREKFGDGESDERKGE